MKREQSSNIFTESIRHIEISRMGYLQHLFFAAKSGFLLIYLGVTSVIHAIVPAWFKGDAPMGVIDIFYRNIYHHPNPEFQAHIQAEKAAAEARGHTNDNDTGHNAAA
jgi:hypothetical protein